MTEEEQFRLLVQQAIDNRQASAPEAGDEFDIYADMHYNLFMMVKGKWTSMGINLTPLTDKMF